MTAPILRSLRVGVADVVAAAEFMAHVCGSSVDASEGGETVVAIDDASFIVEAADRPRGGIQGLVVDSEAKEEGAALLNGIEVRVGTNPPRTGTTDSDVVVDHVAVLVEDLESSGKIHTGLFTRPTLRGCSYS